MFYATADFRVLDGHSFKPWFDRPDAGNPGECIGAVFGKNLGSSSPRWSESAWEP